MCGCDSGRARIIEEASKEYGDVVNLGANLAMYRMQSIFGAVLVSGQDVPQSFTEPLGRDQFVGLLKEYAIDRIEPGKPHLLILLLASPPMEEKSNITATVDLKNEEQKTLLSYKELAVYEPGGVYSHNKLLLSGAVEIRLPASISEGKYTLVVTFKDMTEELTIPLTIPITVELETTSSESEK